jgi:L-ribulose-5-phosphate 3-epimerase
MYLGYNTNGLAHHDLFDAVELLAEIGYRGVAITVDHNALSPRDPQGYEKLVRLKRLLEKLDMRSVIETGARFLLDPRRKHEPTLLSADPRRRIEFYKYAIDCAAQLGSDCVSLWSGKPVLAEQGAMDRLVVGLRETLDYAAAKNVAIAFEPEPGMLIDSMPAFEQLVAHMAKAGAELRLTLDIGHLHCQGETPIAGAIRRWAPRLANVHIEDMRAGRHEHLMFGEGEIDFPPILQALAEVDYTGGVYVELSRHSHMGPEAAKTAFEFLQQAMKNAKTSDPPFRAGLA